MYYPFVNYWKAVKLFNGPVSWQKQVMDKGQNLIDFGEKVENVIKHNAHVTSNAISEPSSENAPAIQSESSGTNASVIPPKPGRTNKSLFAITCVDNIQGESAGDNDSEFDDTFSETHDSSSTSIVENIMKHDDSPETSNTIDVADHCKPLTVSVETQPATTCDSTTSSASSTPPVNAAPAASAEPPSRFRIVKITKNKPYEKGKWSVSDYQDSQKQVESSCEIPASPVVKRNTHTTSVNTNTHSTVSNHKQSSDSSGEQKLSDNNKDITSPNTNIDAGRSKSSEIFSTLVNSRGSSYNVTIGERRSSHDREYREERSSNLSPSSTPNVTPMVEALESALDQIHSIKESMLQSFTEEMKRLKDNIVILQTENAHLKDENDSLKRLQDENLTLKKRIVYLEEKLKIDKG